MYLAFRLPLQLDTVTQANALYLWTDIVSDANWPPGEYAPNACCTAPGNIGVVTPLALTCVDDCTADYDADGVVNYDDNCPFAPNPNQANTDANNSSLGLPGYDSYGDACDDNISGDGYTNEMHAAYSKNPADYCALMRADIDGDGSVSTPDLARVGKSFGLTFTHNFFPLSGVDAGVQRRDQNGDNAIGTPDLGFVGKRFGHSVTECP